MAAGLIENIAAAESNLEGALACSYCECRLLMWKSECVVQYLSSGQMAHVYAEISRIIFCANDDPEIDFGFYQHLYKRYIITLILLFLS